MTTKQINIRLDENLVNNVTPILSNLGLSIADACRIFLSKVIIDDGIPFVLKNKKRGDIPNKETVRALTEGEFERIENIEDIWKC